MRNDARFLRHTSSAVFTDSATGAQVSVTMHVYSDDSSGWAIVQRSDGTINQFDMPLSEVVWWSAFLFPVKPPGTQAPPPTVTLTTVSETRATIRRRLHEKWSRPESFAAD